jgi:hypothetical protein
MIVATHGVMQKAGGAAYHPAYQAVLTYAATLSGVSLPNDAKKLVQNQLVVDLDNAGIWDKLDHFQVWATPANSIFAAIDWKNPNNSRLSTIYNTVTFTSNQGFQGDGSVGGGYIDSNFNPSTMASNYELDNASFGYYMRVIDTAPSTAEGAFTASGTTLSWIRYITTKRIYLNSSAVVAATNFVAASDQFAMATRASSSQVKLYSNGSLTDTLSIASSAMPNANFLAFRAGAAYSNCQLGMVFAGADLSAEASSFNLAWRAYLTNIVL